MINIINIMMYVYKLLGAEALGGKGHFERAQRHTTPEPILDFSTVATIHLQQRATVLPCDHLAQLIGSADRRASI